MLIKFIACFPKRLFIYIEIGVYLLIEICLIFGYRPEKRNQPQHF